MKTAYLILFIVTIGLQNCLATEIVISNSGNSKLDGVYISSNVEEKLIFKKKESKEGLKIVPFNLQTTNELITGWIVTDSAQNEYYASNSISSMPPIDGWDVGRSGVNLNSNFDITIKEEQIDDTYSMKNDNENFVTIFPNPTFGQIQINSQIQIVNIEIKNNSGITIKKTQSKTIDLSELPKATYFIVINYESTQIVKQIIKK